MATINQLQSKFTANASGLLSEFRTIEQQFNDLPKASQQAMKKVSKSFDSLGNDLKALDNEMKKSGKSFDSKTITTELGKAQKEFKETGNISKSTMDSLNKSIKNVDFDSLPKEAQQSIKRVNDSFKTVEKQIGKINNINFLDSLPADARKTGQEVIALEKHFNKMADTIKKSDDSFDTTKMTSEINKMKRELQETGQVTERTMDNIQREIDQTDFSKMSLSAQTNFKRMRNDMDGIKGSMDNIDNQKLGQHMKNDLDEANRSTGRLRDSIKGIGPVLIASLTGASIVGFTKQIVESTAEINALQSQYEQVMGKMKNDTDTYLDAMSKKYNVHPNELKKSMLQYQAILKSKGLSEQDAYKTSKMWLERTVDGSSFANESMEQSTARMMGIIKGEYDSADTVMINLSQTMLNDKAQEVYGKKWENLTVKQQENLKVQESLRQHNKAGVFGQGVKEADSYERNIDQLKNTWTDFLASYGGPALNVANNGLKGAIGIIKGMEKGFKTISGLIKELSSSKPANVMQKIGFSHAEAKSISGWFNTLQENLSKARGSVKGFFQLFQGNGTQGVITLSKLGLKPETIQKLDAFVQGFKKIFTSAFNEIGKQSRVAFSGILKFFAGPDGQQLIQAVQNIFGFILKVVKFTFPLVKYIVTDVWNSIVGVIKGGMQVIKGIIQVFSGLFTGDFKKMWEGIKNIFFGAIRLIWNYVQLAFYGKLLKGVMGFVKLFFGSLKGMWSKVFGLFKSSGSSIFKNITGVFNNMLKSVKNIFGNLVRWLINSNKNLLKNMTGLFKSLWTNVSKVFSNMRSGLSKTWTAIKNTAKAGGDFVRKTVVNAFSSMWSGVSKFTKKIKDGVIGMKDSVVSQSKKLANGLKEHAIGGLNKMIDGINWVADKLGMGKPIPRVKYSTGTGAHPEDGFATVGDKGPGNGKGTRELVEFPNGRTALFEEETTFFMPKGTRVYNNKQTENILDATKYSRGTTGQGGSIIDGIKSKVKAKAVDLAGDMARNTVHNTKKVVNGSKKVASGVKNGVHSIKEKIGDVWDYATHPTKLVGLIIDKFGVNFDGIKKVPGKIMGAGFGMIKKGAGKLIKKWFDEAGGDADGSSFMGFPMTTPYSPNAPVPGYPRAFNGGRHYGVDFGTPAGTTLRATTSGVVAKQHDFGGGLVARLLSGKYAQYFLHLSRILRTGRVKKGQAFAKTGNSGNYTTGAHLHYQVETPPTASLTNRNTTNPLTFLKSKGLSTGSAPGNVSSWISQAIARTGVPKSWAPYLKTIAKYESNYDAGAVQHGYTDVNTGGNEARGLMQVTPQTYASLMGTRSGIMNPVNNVMASIKWIKSRYGSITNIPGMASGTWHGGYKNGGVISGDGIYRGGEEGKEIVIPTVKKRRNRANQLIELASRMVNGKRYSKGTGAGKPSTYKVKSGDTLWDISRKYNTTVANLQKLNNIKTHLIFPNQILKLAGSIDKISKNMTGKSGGSRSSKLLDWAGLFINRGTQNSKTSKSDTELGKLIQDKMKNIGKQTLADIKAGSDSIIKKVDDIIKSSTSKLASAKAKLKTSKTKTSIVNAKEEIRQYTEQLKALKKLKQSEVLKTDFIKNLFAQRERLIKKMEELKAKEQALRESKDSFKSSMKENLMGYAGFGSAKGNTARDFVEFMKYRLGKVKKFSGNINKLRSMGLDPEILRELVAGGIEQAMPRAEVLISGGKGYIQQINALQKQVKDTIDSISGKQSDALYDPDIKKAQNDIKANTKQQTTLDKKAQIYMTKKPTASKVTNKKPTKKPTASKTPKMVSHKIVWGDTLGALAIKYKTSVSAIKKANKLKNDMIYAGKTLKIPKGIKAYADGGIAVGRQLALVGDGGFAESIISHDPTKRKQQRELWRKTGDKLGFDGDDEMIQRKILAVLEGIYDVNKDYADKPVNVNIDTDALGRKMAGPVDRHLATRKRMSERGLANGK